MSSFPSSWATTKIGDVVVDCEQQVPELEEEFLYIDIASIDRDTKRITMPQRLLGINAPSRARKVVMTGDVLVSMTRPNLNAVAIVPAELDGQIASTGLEVLRAPELDSRWLFGLVRTREFVDRMSDLVQGALYPAVRSKDIRSVEVPLAPRIEQKRIADKLDAVLSRVEASRERLDRIPAILKRFRQSVLAAATSGKLTEEWRSLNPRLDGAASQEVQRNLHVRRAKGPAGKKFKEPSDPDLSHWATDVPPSWSVESVSAYAECLDHLRIPVTKSKRSNAIGRYPYYGANGQVDMVDEYLFDDELVLVTEDETFYGREKPIAYRVSGRCWVNNHAHVLLAGDKVRADYLCFALMHYQVIPWLTGTTGRAKLTQGVLNSLPIGVPPQAEMIEIVRRVSELFAYADRIESRYTAARAPVERLTPALLAKAFRGELVPQDPNDEPASQLLARIQLTRSNDGAHMSKPKPTRKRNSTVVAVGAIPSASASSASGKGAVIRRTGVSDAHLSGILKKMGSLTPEALWKLSQLDIDNFYDQLQDEEKRGLLREQRRGVSGEMLLLETK